MRRFVVIQLLMFAVASVAGCSNSSSPDVAQAAGTTDPSTTASQLTSEAVTVATGEESDEPMRPRVDPTTLPADIADGADSDAPGGYQPLADKESENSPVEVRQIFTQEAIGAEATKGDARRADSDDVEALLIIPKVAEQQEDAPLNNGREPTAQPIPDGQRVAAAAASVAPSATEVGRESNAKPGVEVSVTDPEKEKPTTKPPADKHPAEKRKTLADLPKSIQGLDTDSDGQLGLYEWPREKLAEFKKLDSNKDGFLTPVELVAGQNKPSETKSPSSDKASAADKAAAEKEEKSEEETSVKTDVGSQPEAESSDQVADESETKSESESTDATSDDENTNKEG